MMNGVIIMQPKITIIVPLYNKVKEVARSLESILKQTISEYELLIIDGGSTDGSLKVVEPYLQDSRIHLLHQKSKGLPAARNEAIYEAKGDLIAFLDADDEWHLDFLETIIYLYNTYPGAGIYATSYERCAIDIFKPSPLHGLPKPWEGYLESYFKVYVESGFPPFCPCCVALSKDVFDKVGYFNPESSIGEDIEMWAKGAFHTKIAFTTKICARYHLVASNKMIYNFQALDMLPAVTYLESLPIDVLRSNSQYNDIMLYLEFLKLITAYFNIGAGNRAHAKKLLGESHSHRFVLKRTFLKIIASFPVSIGCFTITCYSQLPVWRYDLVRKLNKTSNFFKHGC